MLMFTRLPTSLKIANKSYPINTDFRVMIRYEETIAGIELYERDEQNEQLLRIFKRFMPAFFDIAQEGHLADFWAKFQWFYRCGREDYHRQETGEGSGVNLYSYRHDDEYIYAAFKAQYGIDLDTADLHWWKFHALMVGLDDCMFTKIKGYRSYTGNDKDLLKLKNYWKLPLNEAQQKHNEEVINFLLQQEAKE